jgi:hypothetical protein
VDHGPLATHPCDSPWSARSQYHRMNFGASTLTIVVENSLIISLTQPAV